MGLGIARKLVTVLGTNRAATYEETILAGLTGVYAYWPCDELSGAVASDVSANARHCAYTDVTLNAAAGPTPSMGRAGTWNGTTSNATSTGTHQGPQTGITVSLWWKPVSVATGAQIIFAHRTATKGYLQFFATTNDVIFRIHQARDSIYIGRIASDVLDTSWQNFIGTWTGTTVKIYRNGVQVDTGASNSGSFSAPETEVLPWLIGKQDGAGSPAAGNIMHVVVLDHAATPAEIAILYAPI